MPYFIIIFLTLLLSGFTLKAVAQSGHPAQDRQTSPFKELTHYPEVAAEAKQKNLPVLLMFGAEWCEFCGLLEEEVLAPMALSGDYEGQYMLMRHVALDDHSPFINAHKYKPRL